MIESGAEKKHDRRRIWSYQHSGPCNPSKTEPPDSLLVDLFLEPPDLLLDDLGAGGGEAGPQPLDGLGLLGHLLVDPLELAEHLGLLRHQALPLGPNLEQKHVQWKTWL